MSETSAVSRVAKNPIPVPSGVEFKFDNSVITVKGSKGTLTLNVHEVVNVQFADANVLVRAKQEAKDAKALVGTTAALVKNMLHGVSQGFEKKLLLVGVGYRAQMKGKALVLSLGLSHPVEYTPPEGITIELPSQTEIVIKGADKQLVGETAAIIRQYRLPEPYKGKGIRLSLIHI